ncbi:mannosyl-oligosaccharide alpha-1,2-mannosidase IA-like [Drosophila subobscura]|uniref:mannosyl-oligosaccharide alpha-1,2-mannosidase IA-like n=1 Tax=Drosophila subobscura TaxID=7241 RepID=UPI00155B2430|nr:mannosyl-oligosaccharide alpha-1,2-mannosidase IA-like [Drosophila subobscura]
MFLQLALLLFGFLQLRCPASASNQFGFAGHADARAQSQRQKVKEMMKFAWNGYAQHAWEHNELNSVLGAPHNGSIMGQHKIGLSIVDNLDTLYIMGLQEEYNRGYQWVRQNFSLDHVDEYLSVSELNVHFVGGLLSMYAFTGSSLFQSKAEDVVKKLLPAFTSMGSGIPQAMVNPKRGVAGPRPGAYEAILSEIGSLHLEFSYITEITGHLKYRNYVHQLRDKLENMLKPRSLYPVYLNPRTAAWGPYKMTLGTMGDIFYEYLLKNWLRSGKTNKQSRDLYQTAVGRILVYQLGLSSAGLTYLGELANFHVIRRMEHRTCFAGGLFALGASAYFNDSVLAARHLQVGKELAHTCHESYRRTPTGLGPESFQFDSTPEEDATATGQASVQKAFRLRPEVVETYFILWRLTHDQKYRDWGWEVVEALERHCRTEFGYSGLENVYLKNGPKDGVQPSYFMAETLKYLYLLFSNDTLLPLDKWVFNTGGHPLPIQYVNKMFRSKKNVPEYHLEFP